MMINKLISEIEVTKAQIEHTKTEIKQLITDVRNRALELDYIDVENQYNKNIMHSITFSTEEYIGLVTRLSNLEEKLDILNSILEDNK